MANVCDWLVPSAVLGLELYNALLQSDNDSFAIEIDGISFKAGNKELKFHNTELKLYHLRSYYAQYGISDDIYSCTANIFTLMDIYRHDSKRIPEFYITWDKNTGLWGSAYDILLYNAFRKHISKVLEKSIKNKTITNFKELLLNNSFQLPYSSIIKYDEYMSKLNNELERSLGYSDCKQIVYWLLKGEYVNIKYLKNLKVLPHNLLLNGNNIVNDSGSDGVFSNSYLLLNNYVIFV